jgi:hypothetical protein
MAWRRGCYPLREDLHRGFVSVQGRGVASSAEQHKQASKQARRHVLNQLEEAFDVSVYSATLARVPRSRPATGGIPSHYLFLSTSREGIR